MYHAFCPLLERYKKIRFLRVILFGELLVQLLNKCPNISEDRFLNVKRLLDYIGTHVY